MKHFFSRYFRKKNNVIPVPHYTLPYDQFIKRQRRTFLISFLIILLTTLFYTYFQAKAKIEQEQHISVWVATQELVSSQKIEEKHYEKKHIPKKYLPQGFIESGTDILDNILVMRASHNQVLTQYHFASLIGDDSISTEFDQNFAISIGEDWLAAKIPHITQHDTVDVLVSNPQKNIKETLFILRNILVIGVEKNEKKNQTTLFLNVNEDEARTLLYSRGEKLPMHLVVHPSASPASNSLPDLDETQ